MTKPDKLRTLLDKYDLDDELYGSLYVEVETLIAEAIFIEQEAILDFAERRQLNGCLVPIEAGLLPWLKDRINLKELLEKGK